MDEGTGIKVKRVPDQRTVGIDITNKSVSGLVEILKERKIRNTYYWIYEVSDSKVLLCYQVDKLENICKPCFNFKYIPNIENELDNHQS